MSQETNTHTTIGFERYEAFVNALQVVAIKVATTNKQEAFMRHYGVMEEVSQEEQYLRIGTFTPPDGRRMKVEEYLELLCECNHDGSTVTDGYFCPEQRIGIAIYPDGERSIPETKEVCWRSRGPIFGA